MLINLQTGKSRVDERVNYLLNGAKGERNPDAVHILDGDPELFVEIAKHNPYKTKTYNYLISFAESKRELERKLREKGKTIEELYEEIISLLLPAEYYPREALNILAVAHSDTDNFHIHLTVENYDHQNQKSLYIPKTKTELEFYRALEKYISLKYGLSMGSPELRNKGRTGVEKIKQILEERGTYKNKTRDEVKEEITNHLTELILSGELKSRVDLIAYLQTINGLEIKRIGKSYISFEYAGQRYRLKGGIYDEQGFREIKERIEGKEPDLQRVAGVFKEAQRKREESLEKRRGRGRSFDRGRIPEPDRERNEELERGAWEPIRGVQPDKVDINRAWPFDWLGIADRDIDIVENALTSPVPEPAPSLLQVGRTELRRLSNLHSQRGSLHKHKREVGRAEWRGESGRSDFSVAKRRLTELRMKREKLKEIRREEIQLLKELSPEEVGRALGIEWRERNGYLITNSPLREDKNPSFQAFWGTERNCWVYMDFGTGWTGSSIDLWQAIRGVDYITAVQEMREYFGLDLFEEDLEERRRQIRERVEWERRRQRENRERLAKKERAEKERASHRVLEVRAPKHSALINYLKERGIREIPDWLKEIRYLYLPNKKYYFALAVKDANGVWHSRNPYGKVNILTSPDQTPTFSYIKRAPGNRTVVVVEGFFDALTLNQEIKKPYDIIILNSTANTKKLIESGILELYDKVFLALDRDEAGQKAEKELLSYLKELDTLVARLEYSGGKDLNEALVNKGRLEYRLKNITPERFYIGKVENRAVISDSKEVLKKLGALHIKRVSNADGFAEFWRKYRCKGSVLLYAKKKPEWLEKGLRKAVWIERSKPVWATREIEEKITPYSLEQKAYYKVDGEIVLEDEVKRDPERYLENSHPEVRRLAEKEKLKELQIKREKEPQESFLESLSEERTQEAEEEEDEDYDYGPGL